MPTDINEWNRHTAALFVCVLKHQRPFAFASKSTCPSPRPQQFSKHHHIDLSLSLPLSLDLSTSRPLDLSTSRPLDLSPRSTLVPSHCLEPWLWQIQNEEERDEGIKELVDLVLKKMVRLRVCVVASLLPTSLDFPLTRDDVALVCGGCDAFIRTLTTTASSPWRTTESL